MDYLSRFGFIVRKHRRYWKGIVLETKRHLLYEVKNV